MTSAHRPLGDLMTYDRYAMQNEFGDDLDDIASEIRGLRASEARLRDALSRACGDDQSMVAAYLGEDPAPPSDPIFYISTAFSGVAFASSRATLPKDATVLPPEAVDPDVRQHGRIWMGSVCSKCEGTGNLNADHDTMNEHDGPICPSCSGSGKVSS